jgi:hypothetical protein
VLVDGGFRGVTSGRRGSQVPADAPRREIAWWKWLTWWIRYPPGAWIHRISRIHRVNPAPRPRPVLPVLLVLEWSDQSGRERPLPGKRPEPDRRLGRRGRLAFSGPGPFGFPQVVILGGGWPVHAVVLVASGAQVTVGVRLPSRTSQPDVPPVRSWPARCSVDPVAAGRDRAAGLRFLPGVPGVPRGGGVRAVWRRDRPGGETGSRFPIRGHSLPAGYDP